MDHSVRALEDSSEVLRIEQIDHRRPADTSRNRQSIDQQHFVTVIYQFFNGELSQPPCTTSYYDPHAN
jgi:hypothetical protein